MPEEELRNKGKDSRDSRRLQEKTSKVKSTTLGKKFGLIHYSCCFTLQQKNKSCFILKFYLTAAHSGFVLLKK